MRAPGQLLWRPIQEFGGDAQGSTAAERFALLGAGLRGTVVRFQTPVRTGKPTVGLELAGRKADVDFRAGIGAAPGRSRALSVAGAFQRAVAVGKLRADRIGEIRRTIELRATHLVRTAAAGADLRPTIPPRRLREGPAEFVGLATSSFEVAAPETGKVIFFDTDAEESVLTLEVGPTRGSSSAGSAGIADPRTISDRGAEAPVVAGCPGLVARPHTREDTVRVPDTPGVVDALAGGLAGFANRDRLCRIDRVDRVCAAIRLGSYVGGRGRGSAQVAADDEEGREDRSPPVILWTGIR